MRVSIGMTAFNAADSLPRAVDSALAQDWSDIEILIVDDVSEDETAQILEGLARAHPDRIRVFRNTENLGVAGCRNVLIRQASGDFLTFFDDDDISAPNRISRQVQRILDYERDFAGGAPVICHTARRQTYPDGHERVEPTLGAREGGLAPHGPDVAAHILFNHPLPGDDYGSMATCSQMARRSVYESIGGFDPDFRRSSDTELNIRLARTGAHFVGISDPLVHQIMTYGTDKRILAERLYALKFYDKHADFLRARGRGDFDRAWLGVKYDYLQGFNARFLIGMIKLFVRHPVLTMRRILRALPHFGYNRVFRNFHRPGKIS